MGEEKSEIPFDPGLKFLWVCAMGFLSYINYCLFHLWGYFTWNFRPACLQPELHWLPSPVLCTREEVLPLSFPRPSLLLHQRCPIVYILSSVFSHFLFFLGSFKYQWASPGLKKPSNKQINKQTLPTAMISCLFLLSHYQFLRKSILHFSHYQLPVSTVLLLCICFLYCQLLFPLGLYILFLQLDRKFPEGQDCVAFFSVFPMVVGTVFTISPWLYLLTKLQSQTQLLCKIKAALKAV